MPAVSVIVPARDAQATLPALLSALAAQVPVEGEHEVIVVDDGSTDATADLARAAGAIVVAGPAEGPARARNAGAARAEGAILAFTDADCAPTPAWLRAGLDAIDAGADLVQGAVAPPPGVPVGPFDRTLHVSDEYGLYESANLFVRRELFERLGGFESWLRPRTGIELGEDVLLGWSARRAGARTAFSAEALVHHAVFPRGARSYVAERWRLRLFPALARRVPELRERFFYRRVFLSRRSAAFDLALAGVVATVAVRSAVPVVAAAPYAVLALRAARRAPRVLAAQVAADAVGAAALAVGSVRARSPLI